MSLTYAQNQTIKRQVEALVEAAVAEALHPNLITPVIVRRNRQRDLDATLNDISIPPNFKEKP